MAPKLLNLDPVLKCSVAALKRDQILSSTNVRDKRQKVVFPCSPGFRIILGYVRFVTIIQSCPLGHCQPFFPAIINNFHCLVRHPQSQFLVSNKIRGKNNDKWFLRGAVVISDPRRRVQKNTKERILSFYESGKHLHFICIKKVEYSCTWSHRVRLIGLAACCRSREGPWPWEAPEGGRDRWCNVRKAKNVGAVWSRRKKVHRISADPVVLVPWSHTCLACLTRWWSFSAATLSARIYLQLAC